MTENRSSYRQIMKATSLFGGVQVFNIIISIAKSKFAAIILGPSGFGIIALLQSTIGLVSGLTNFGLGISAVKDIAATNEAGNHKRIATVVIAFRRWVWITGTFGSLATLAFSPWLSELTFGNRDYTVAFAWLSITLLFNQLSSGQFAILQGMRKLQFLAKSNMAGTTISLFVTVPLYFLYGKDAIVPVIIITSIVTLCLSWYFSNKIKIEPVKVSKVRTIAEGKNMLIMGFAISISPLLAVASSYIVRAFISNQGGPADVGLYSAGFVILNTYVGLIFTAMLTDFYPRLAGVAYSNNLCKQTINQQIEIALLILGPMVVGLMVFIKWLIILLYSKQFLLINEMMYWAALGIFFKTINWAIGFILIVKNDPWLFFWSDLIANIYMLALNLIGYHFWGLTGLGVSFMIGYLLATLQVFLIAKIKFEFNIMYDVYKIYLIQFILAISGFIVVKSIDNPYQFIVGVILIGISTTYSYNELDKKIGIKEVLLEIKNKYLGPKKL